MKVQPVQPLLQSNLHAAGLIALLISSAVFTFTLNIEEDNAFFGNSFFICYGICLIYLISVMIDNRQKTGRAFKFYSITHNILLLLLANISAYALNRNIPVFNISTNWLSIFLVILNLALLAISFRRKFTPDGFNHVLVAFLSASVLLNLYEVFYVTPYYVFGVMAFWFFGIAMHIFVPFWWLVLSVLLLRRFIKTSPTYWKSVGVGLALPFIFTVFYIGKWNGINQELSNIYYESKVPLQEQELPRWVEASQRMQHDWMTEKVLKSGFVYTVATGEVFSVWGDLPNLEERKKHDPFVVMASIFSTPLKLNQTERVQLLNAFYDARHQTERRLWSGDNLVTKDIVTNVQLFPKHRLAYTEKTISIEHTKKRSWSNTQEALYTFHLPEGSVVTSAALWVNGVERPAYLTTKSKADSAYTTIVGRERRDPLLVHWQEGNRVTARIFPCTPSEPRQFKLGITTPLKLKEGKLKYENIDFEGPFWEDATESINLVVEGDLVNLETSLPFEEQSTYWMYAGKYRSDWTLEFDDLGVSKDGFAFNGRSFHLEPHTPEKENFSPEFIYLDLNASWTKREFEQVWNLVQDKEVFVYQKGLIPMNKHNKSRLFKHLQRWNYSLFPFHKIHSPEKALVISKSKNLTPVLSDLKGCIFAKNLNDFLLKNEQPVRFFHIGDQLSPYLKTLKELRVLQVHEGDVSNLLSCLTDKQFYTSNETERNILLDHAKVRIVENSTSGNTPSTAPDHLMRLFVYNNLMRQTGRNYFKQRHLESTLLAQAQEAHVLTPISSLIVLETQKDYDRFDIKKSKNSLKNASIESSGSVPEPHEWMLILLCLSLAGWLYFKQKKPSNLRLIP